MRPAHYWIAGRARRLKDEGTAPKAALLQARQEWAALSPEMRALYLAPVPERPCFAVLADRSGGN